MIDAPTSGKLYAKPREGTSRNGNIYATARLLVAVGTVLSCSPNGIRRI